MADEKKTDEKPKADEKPKKKGAAALYDNSDMGGGEKKGGYIAGQDEPGSEAVDRQTPKGDGEASKADGEANAASTPKDKFMEGLAAVRKRHEKERDDYHNGHRESLKSMSSRHDKEFGDLWDIHFKEGQPSAGDGKTTPDAGGKPDATGKPSATEKPKGGEAV